MSLISKITDFTPGAVIASQPFDNEFAQLVDLLSGVSQNKSIRVISNDSSFAAARFDQRGVNHILELYGDGVEAARVEKDGDLVVAGLTGVAGTYTFANIPVGPNLNPSSDNQFARKKYVDETTTAFSIPFVIESPNTPSINRLLSSWVVPDGIQITVTKLASWYVNGAHTPGHSLTLNIERRTAASLWVTATNIGSVGINDTNDDKFVVYPFDIADLPIAPGDIFSPFIQARSGTLTEETVVIAMIGTQKRI